MRTSLMWFHPDLWTDWKSKIPGVNVSGLSLPKGHLPEKTHYKTGFIVR